MELGTPSSSPAFSSFVGPSKKSVLSSKAVSRNLLCWHSIYLALIALYRKGIFTSFCFAWFGLYHYLYCLHHQVEFTSCGVQGVPSKPIHQKSSKHSFLLGRDINSVLPGRVVVHPQDKPEFSFYLHSPPYLSVAVHCPLFQGLSQILVHSVLQPMGSTLIGKQYIYSLMWGPLGTLPKSSFNHQCVCRNIYIEF